MQNIAQASAHTGRVSGTQPAVLPCGLYIHIPWCVHKCPYCDFNSHAIRATVPEAAYANSLIDDFDAELADIDFDAFESIYFGGGTPSVFAPETIERILAHVDSRVSLANTEITLEANPGTVDSARFDGFQRAGVNRLSLGVQSFNDAHLKTLGRIHDGADALNAARAASQAGFGRMNLDLMFALPGQTITEALDDIERALALTPSHLSCYQLTIEPNTAFAQSPPPMLDSDLASDMHDAIIARLAENGFERYEVSAFAHHGDVSRHNVNYWSFGDYIGIGAGAHGKITMGSNIIRRAKVRHPRRYLDAPRQAQRVQRQHAVTNADRSFEFMLNALRLTDGFSSALFSQRTGLPISQIQPVLDEAVNQNLLIINQDRIRASKRGYRMLDDLVAMFLETKD